MLGGQHYDVFVFQRDQPAGKPEKNLPLIVYYEFYPSEPALPDSFFDHSILYKLELKRNGHCDQTVKALRYQENVDETGKHLPRTETLRYLDGAPRDLPPPDVVLPCYALRPGQYKSLIKRKDK